MSVEHKAPSTYILRELNDVTVPDPVSWMPQTVGWKILATVIAGILLYIAYRQLIQWWHNRYRGEALAAIESITASDVNASRALHHVLTVVQTHLDRRSGAFYGKSFLTSLDMQAGESSSTTFNDELGTNWLESLVNPRIQLSEQDVIELKARAKAWVVEHKNTNEVDYWMPISWLKKGSKA